MIEAHKAKLGRPPRSDRPDTRDRILNAALEVFSERGYEGTTERSAAKQREMFLHQLALSAGGVLHFRVKNMVNIVAHLGCLFMESQSHGSYCLDRGGLRRINHRNAKGPLNISAITSHSSAAHDQNVSPMFSY